MNPRAGDIHWAIFDPSLGTEQAGQRPALVISDSAYNARSNRIVVCPITSRIRDWPFDLRLPDGAKTRGVVLCDQIRALDKQARLHGLVERVPDVFLADVRRVLSTLLEIDQPPV